MPIRHRANLSRPNEPHRCPKDLHARLRDPKCRKEMKDIPDPTPQPTPQPRPPVPPTPPPTPTPTPIIPITPFIPIPTPSSGGGGLTPAEIAAITGGSLLGAAAIGIGAATAISQMKGAAGYDKVAGSETEADQADLGDEPVQAELAPVEETAEVGGETEMTTLSSGGAAASAEQAAGTTAERQSVLSGARAAAATTPATEGTPEEIEMATMGATDDAAVPAGSGATITSGATTSATPAAQTATLDAPVETATATDSGELAADTSAVSSAAPVETAAASATTDATATGLAEAAAETEVIGGGPEDPIADVVAGGLLVAAAGAAIATNWDSIADTFFGGTVDVPYAQNSSYIGNSNGNSGAVNLYNQSTYQSASLSALQSQLATATGSTATSIQNTINAINNQTSSTPVYQYTDTDGSTQYVQKLSTAGLAQAILNYRNDPNYYQGSDPNVLALQGLNPNMALGEAGGKNIGTATNKTWIPNVSSDADTEASGVPAPGGNSYLSSVDMGSITGAAQSLYVKNSDLQTIIDSASTTAAPTTGGTSAQIPSSAAASSTTAASTADAIPTTGGTTAQKPATTTTSSTTQGTALSTTSPTTQKTQNK